MDEQELKDLLESIRLITEFFVDTPEKVPIWFNTKNPHLGELRPIDLFYVGRGRKVLAFIQNALDENTNYL